MPQRLPFPWHEPKEPNTAEQSSRSSSTRFLEFLGKTLVKGSEIEFQKAKEKLNLLAANYNKTDPTKHKRKQGLRKEYEKLATTYNLQSDIDNHSSYSIARRR